MATIIGRQGNVYQLQTQRQSSCNACASKSGCGTSTLSNYMGNKPIVFEVTDSLEFQPGDRVEVAIPENGVLWGSFMIYILPLLSFMLGYVIGEHVFAMSDLSLLLALLSLAGSFMFVRSYINKANQDGKFYPVILRRIQGEEIGINFLNR